MIGYFKYRPFTKSFFLLIAIVFLGCQSEDNVRNTSSQIEEFDPYILVLGTVQDAGSPQIGCFKDCCKKLHENPDYTRKVVSLALVIPSENEYYLFEASPDIASQMAFSQKEAESEFLPKGIFLSHAHIGHYSGLMFLGKEALSTKFIDVYAMPRMSDFLKNNGPWNQLVNDSNIVLKSLKADQKVFLKKSIVVVPILVPHRDEYSETVGFRIDGPNKSVLFIPDIDKWEKWQRNILKEIESVDYAFIDATFYDGNELPGRDMSHIPHPFVAESMGLISELKESEIQKVRFIHINHTNPLLDSTSVEYDEVYKRGFNVAQFGDRYEL